MKTFTFDFAVQAWIKGLEIEAETYEEAEKELLSMSLEKIVDKGFVKDSDISDIECETEDDNAVEDDDDEDYSEYFDDLDDDEE